MCIGQWTKATLDSPVSQWSPVSVPIQHQVAIYLTATCLFLPSASPSISPVPPRRSSSPPSTVVGIRGPAVPGHLDPQLPTIQERSVHGVHRILGVPFVVEPHKSEPTAFFSVAVSGNVDVPYPAILLEYTSECFGRCSVGEVVHFEGSHAVDVRRRPTVTHGD